MRPDKTVLTKDLISVDLSSKFCCKGSKQTEVESTYGELNKNTQKTMMLRAGINLGESSYGIQLGLSKTHKRDFTATGYKKEDS